VAARDAGVQAGSAPYAQAAFSSRFEATQRIEIGVDIPLDGRTIVTPLATAGFSEAQLALGAWSNLGGVYTFGNASDFKLGAAYGGGFELKVAGSPKLQILYLRHEYNATTSGISGGVIGVSLLSAKKGLVEDELRVGLAIPLPRL